MLENAKLGLRWGFVVTIRGSDRLCLVAAKFSAGILVFRHGGTGLEVLLGHPGGPFFARRDDGVWSIPKGEYDPDVEPAYEAAHREFAEELGLPVPEGNPLALGAIRQPGGKTVTIWAIAGELDPGAVVPGTFAMQWPPRSGRMVEFPELDRVGWFDLDTAGVKLTRGQRPFLDRLVSELAQA